MVKELKSRILLRKIAEIFIIALNQTAEFRTTKSLLMQDWVFRLGKQLYTTIILRIFAHKPHLRADLKSSTGLQANIS